VLQAAPAPSTLMGLVEDSRARQGALPAPLTNHAHPPGASRHPEGLEHPGSRELREVRAAGAEPVPPLGTDRRPWRRVLRVVTLEDKVTMHNAFPDRGFRP
jgi:hypothetical protein